MVWRDAGLGQQSSLRAPLLRARGHYNAGRESCSPAQMKFLPELSCGTIVCCLSSLPLLPLGCVPCAIDTEIHDQYTAPKIWLTGTGPVAAWSNMGAGAT